MQAIRSILAIWAITALLFIAPPSAVAADAEWQEYIAHGDITAYVQSGDWCGKSVDILLKAPNEGLLQRGDQQLANLYNTVHLVLTSDCPAAKQVHIVGQTKNRRHFQTTVPIEKLAPKAADDAIAQTRQQVSEISRSRSSSSTKDEQSDSSSSTKDEQSDSSSSIEDDQSYWRLFPAAENGAVDKVKRLLEDGVKVSGRDGDGNTPLHLAAYHSAPKVAKVLVDHGSDVDAHNNDGATPLHYARSSPEVAELLIDNGASVNARDENGETPLHEAVVAGLGPIYDREEYRAQKKVVELLIRNGANVKARNDEGRTPREEADAVVMNTERSASGITMPVYKAARPAPDISIIAERNGWVQVSGDDVPCSGARSSCENGELVCYTEDDMDIDTIPEKSYTGVGCKRLNNETWLRKNDLRLGKQDGRD